MINATNMLGKDNPRWPIGNAPETIKVPDPGVPPPRATVPPRDAAATPAIGISDPPADAGDLIRRAAGIVTAWLAGLPRRAGRRLFAMNDLEARWRGWQVIETAGGLGRQYRDPRFDSRCNPGGRPREAPRHGRAPAPLYPPGAWDNVHGWPWDGTP